MQNNNIIITEGVKGMYNGAVKEAVLLNIDKRAELTIFTKVNELGDFSCLAAPEYMVINIPSIGMKAIREGQRIQGEYSVTAISLYGMADFCYLNEDGSEHEGVTMEHCGNIVIVGDTISAQDTVKHGFDGIESEPVEIGAYKPENKLHIHLDVGDVKETLFDDVFVTTASAQSVLKKLKNHVDYDERISEEAHGKGFQIIPKEYEEVAERLDVNQHYNPCFIPTGMDVDTLIFFDAIKKDDVTPENIEEVIEQAHVYLDDESLMMDDAIEQAILDSNL